MAATGADFLQSLNMILTSREERERDKVKTALAMMQFSIAKRQSDMQAAATGLETLGKFNVKYKDMTAKEFMSTTGFDAIYEDPGDEGSPTDAISNMASRLRKKAWKRFDKDHSEQIASAVYNYRKLNDSTGIINILTELGNDAYLQKTGQVIKGRTMINNFESLGILGSLERIANDAQQSQNNDRDLLREMSEFGKGDYQIDKFGGLYEPAKDAIQEVIEITDTTTTDEGDSLSEYIHQKEDLDATISKSREKINLLVEKSGKGTITKDENEALIATRDLVDEWVEEQSKIITKINIIRDKKREEANIDRGLRGDYSLSEEEHPLTTINYPGF